MACYIHQKFSAICVEHSHSKYKILLKYLSRILQKTHSLFKALGFEHRQVRNIWNWFIISINLGIWSHLSHILDTNTLWRIMRKAISVTMNLQQKYPHCSFTAIIKLSYTCHWKSDHLHTFVKWHKQHELCSISLTMRQVK